MKITLTIKDEDVKEKLRKEYPSSEKGEKITITTDDIKKLMEELKDIWP